MPDAYLDLRLGETRAAITLNQRLLEMHLVRDGDGVEAGARIRARLFRKLGRRGLARFGKEELLVEPWPAGASEGDELVLEVRRASWREPGRERLAKARPAPANANALPSGADPGPLPSGADPGALPSGADPGATSLGRRLAARGLAVHAGWPDWLAEQWDDSFTEAELGLVRFPGGSLQLSPTPAFLAVDVDGAGDDLGPAALVALACLMPLWGLGGSIVVDLPTATRPARMAAAAAFDAAFDAAIAPFPYERTAVNGFGLLQIVCPRRGPSILERARFDGAATAALAVLEEARRQPGTGPLILAASGGARRWIERRPHLMQKLGEERHRPVALAPAGER